MSGYVRHHRHKELFKYPGSSVWWMFIPNPAGGRALRESTGHRDELAAHREYLRRIRRDPVDAAQATERTVYAALQTRLEWLRTNRNTEDPTRKKLSEDTIDFYKKKSGTLVRVLGAERLLSSITPEVIRAYVAQRTEEGAKGTTIDKELTTLSLAVKLASKDGVRCTPVRDLKPDDFKTTYVPRERWLTKEEYGKFSAWWYANRQAAKGAVLDFIVSTGATYPSEVDASKRSEANAKTFEVRLRGAKRELRDRTFIVPSDRRDLFARALKHANGVDDSLFRSWGNIRRDILVACAYLSMCRECEKSKNLWWYNAVNDSWAQGTSQSAGSPRRDPSCPNCKKVPVFEPFCPTDLRRTFAQWLVQAGVPYELAYPIMGHVDDRMLKRIYGRRSATDVGPMIEAVLRGKTQPRLNPGSTPNRTAQRRQ
jgi:integrase